MTEYEVRRAITEVLGHFWQESLETLAALDAADAEGTPRARG